MFYIFYFFGLYLNLDKMLIFGLCFVLLFVVPDLRGKFVKPTSYCDCTTHLPLMSRVQKEKNFDLLFIKSSNFMQANGLI